MIEQVVDIDPLIPDIDRPHLGEAGHVLAVATCTHKYRIARLPSLKVIVASGDDEASREPFDIPLPRRGQRFIEIVDVENDSPFRRGEVAEVRQMSIAARLHAQASHGGVRQIWARVRRVQRARVRLSGPRDDRPDQRVRAGGRLTLVEPFDVSLGAYRAVWRELTDAGRIAA